MTTNKKPGFWTWDMILLAGVNLLFILIIIFCVVILYQMLSAPVETWLGRVFGV